MKRSEMVNFLRNAFLNHLTCNADCCSDDETMYSTILKEIEDLGMLPPYVTRLSNSYNRAEGTMGFTFAEWEDEDNGKTNT